MDTPTTKSAHLQPRTSALMVLLAMAAVYVGILAMLRTNTPQQPATIPAARVEMPDKSALDPQMAWFEGRDALKYSPSANVAGSEIVDSARQMELDSLIAQQMAWQESQYSVAYKSPSTATEVDIAALERDVEWLERYIALAYVPPIKTTIDQATLNRDVEWLEWYNSLTYRPTGNAAPPTHASYDQQIEWIEWYLPRYHSNER